MKIPKRRIIASTFGLAGVLGFGWGSGSDLVAPRAEAQVAGKAAAKGAALQGALAPWTATRTTPPSNLANQGIWAEVVSSTSRWIVVQNEEKQQFPIASDRIHQFLVRWPSSVGDLTPDSMVEATGTQTSSGSMMTDHLDVYEADAQNLVSPTLQNVGGPGQGVTAGYSANYSFINFQSLNFGATNWTEIPTAGATNWTELPNIAATSGLIHVVGRPTSRNPVILAGFSPVPGTASMAVGPADHGMSVTQVTLGTNSYAKKGDLVHLIADSALPRGLDVNQLVLYKKIRLSQFQP